MPASGKRRDETQPSRGPNLLLGDAFDPKSPLKNVDLIRDFIGSPQLATRREELEALLESTDEQPVLLHPNMAGRYRQQVGNLAEALNDDERRAETADLIRSGLYHVFDDRLRRRQP